MFYMIWLCFWHNSLVRQRERTVLIYINFFCYLLHLEKTIHYPSSEITYSQTSIIPSLMPFVMEQLASFCSLHINLLEYSILAIFCVLCGQKVKVDITKWTHKLHVWLKPYLDCLTAEIEDVDCSRRFSW